MNEPRLTDTRIDGWVNLLLGELSEIGALEKVVQA
jgi:hypothetical protein